MHIVLGFAAVQTLFMLSSKPLVFIGKKWKWSMNLIKLRETLPHNNTFSISNKWFEWIFFLDLLHKLALMKFVKLLDKIVSKSSQQFMRQYYCKEFPVKFISIHSFSNFDLTSDRFVQPSHKPQIIKVTDNITCI